MSSCGANVLDWRLVLLYVTNSQTREIKQQTGVRGEVIKSACSEHATGLRRQRSAGCDRLQDDDTRAVAAQPWITEPGQSLFRWQIGDVIEGGPFRQTNNSVPVPEGPGLGVTLDPHELNRWHQHFLEHGPMDHFHDPLRPGNNRRLPLN